MTKPEPTPPAPAKPDRRRRGPNKPKPGMIEVRTELYSGKSVYGLRPASEESIRAYHAPRPMLEARTSREVVVDDDDWDGDGEPIAPTCGGCSEPLGSEPTVLVTDSDTSDNEVWHKRCAEDDAERVDRSTTIDTVGENAGRG